MVDRLFSRAGFKKDSTWSRFVFQWLALSFILHIIGAVKSSGFFYPDEHFQILEFVAFKLGHANGSELSQEFQHLLQPCLLPSFLTWITQFLKTIGITNPFDWALSYRILAALIGWMSVAALSLCSYIWFENKSWRNGSVIALNLIWYIPIFHARHSPENFGGAIFFLGLSLLLLGSSPKTKHRDLPGKCDFEVALLVGFLFGLAFEIRFEIGVMIAGTLLWLLAYAKAGWSTFSVILVGILGAIGIGTLADYWAYGQWTFTPWNYIHYYFIENPSGNVLKQDLVSVFPPVSWIVFGFFLAAWVRNPKHILTAATLPFLLFYPWMPHPRPESLLPIAHVGGLAVILGLLPEAKGTKAFKWSRDAVIGINLVALVFLTVLPAWLPILFYGRFYKFKPYGFQVYFKDQHPFQVGGRTLAFYQPKEVPFYEIHDYSELIQALAAQERTKWLFNSHYHLPENANVLKKWCTVEFSTLPESLGNWFERWNSHSSFERFSNWTLYRCQSPSLLKSTLQQTSQSGAIMPFAGVENK